MYYLIINILSFFFRYIKTEKNITNSRTMNKMTTEIDKYNLEPGTKFKFEDSDTIYEFVGYVTTGEHIIYLEADWQEKYGRMNGAYDINEARYIKEVVNKYISL